MFGVTPQGYVRKKYNDWLVDLQSKARTVEFYGADQDLSDLDPIGIAIKLMSYALDQQEQKVEDYYYSQYPDTAEGVSLDRVLKFGGEVRRGQDDATVPLRFTGAANSPIPIDAICETPQGLRFKTIGTGTIAVDTVDVMAQCMIPGKAGIVPAGQITKLVTNIPGVTAVTNPEPSRGGRDPATDPEAKYNYKNAKTGSCASIASIIRSLYALKGVNFAHVVPNESDIVDSEGRPAHSREVIIDGGDSIEIADVLWRHYEGLKYFGSTQLDVIAENGQTFTMGWSIPTNKDIFIDITITANSNWRESNRVLISTAVIEYIGGIDTVSQGGIDVSTEYSGLGIGKGVHSHHVEAVIKFPGIDDVVASLSFSLPVVAGTRFLNILSRERPVTDNAKVNINVI